MLYEAHLPPLALLCGRVQPDHLGGGEGEGEGEGVGDGEGGGERMARRRGRLRSVALSSRA